MGELQIISRQQPGLISLVNFNEIKCTLESTLSHYRGAVYSEEMVASAKADKKELSRLRREIEDRRKEIKRNYMAPYEDFSEKVKELGALAKQIFNNTKFYR